MIDNCRFGGQSVVTSKPILSGLYVALIGILFLHACVGQDKNFKQALYQRGIEKMKLVANNDRDDLKNAFESAVSIDSENLVNEFVSEFKISDSDAFRFAADGTENGDRSS